jgi:hypothetical protein
MAISSLVPIADQAGAYTVTATTANVLYSFDNTDELEVGIYRITCPAAVTATVYFYDGASTSFAEVSTTGGTVDYNLATIPTKFAFFVGSSSNVPVTFTRIADAITTLGSGTLDTLTNTQTYTQTGAVFVVVVGGGGGGAGNRQNVIGGYDGSGGASGGVQSQQLYLNTNTSVTIGTAGNGGTAADGNAGGATIFGNLTSNGGGGGSPYGASATAGTPGGGGSGATSTPSLYNFVVSGTTGGGGSGTNGIGRGSGIGTGGNGGNNNTANAGSGFGSGGGGARDNTNNADAIGRAGTPGVVYVLRGF